MAYTEAQQKVIDAMKGGATTAVSPSDGNLTDTQKAVLDSIKSQAAASEAPVPPEPTSPWDHYDMTMLKQIGKVLGSSFLQAETSLAGMPADTAEMYNSGVKMLPESVQPYVGAAVRATNPTIGVIQAARAMGWPTSSEMQKNISDAGMLNTPEKGSKEDWSQYLLSNAMTAAIPVGQEATLANAIKGATTSIIPASVAKLVGDSSGSGTAGTIAALVSGLLQHKFVTSLPKNAVASTIANDMPDTAASSLEEAKRLGIPAMAADFIPSRSASDMGVRQGISASRGKAQYLIDALTKRAEDAPARLLTNLEKGVDPTRTDIPTADQHIANLEKTRADLTRPGYAAIETSTKDGNVWGPKAMAQELLNPQAGVSKKPTFVQNAARKIQDILSTPPKEGQNRAPGANTNASAALEARNQIDSMIKSDPRLAEHLTPIRDALTEGLSYSHPEIKMLDKQHTQLTEQIDAVKAGSKAATTGRAKDTITSFNAVKSHPDLPQGLRLTKGFRLGYADKLARGVENVSEGGNPTKPLDSIGQAQELEAVFGPDVKKIRDLEMAGNKSLMTYGEAAGMPPSEIAGLLSRIGQSKVTLGGMTYGGANIINHPGLAMTALAAGGTTLFRALARNKAFLKAAGITDAKELEALINKGKNQGTGIGAAGRAGILYQLNNH